MKTLRNKKTAVNRCIIGYTSIVFVLLLLLNSALFAQKVAQAGMQYLKIGVGADLAGRGDAGIGTVNDINAIFWNPAGLALMEGKQFMFSYNRWIADITHNAAAFGINLGNWGSIGFSMIYMDYGEFVSTVRDPEDNGLRINDGYLDPSAASARGIYLDSDLNPVDFTAGLTYARKFTERFWMGGQIKMIYQDLGSNLIQRVDSKGQALGPEEIVDSKLTTIAFDFGTVYRPNYAGLSFAVAFQHFGPENKYQIEEFPLPFTFKMGISMDMRESLLNPDSPHGLLLLIDTIKPNDYDQRMHFGAEYDFRKMFFLRGGYKWNYDLESFAAGLGVHINMGDIRWKIDMSYTQMERFTSPLRFSIAGQF